ncbi:uncharacterized protein BYT42DRAFT_261895 [Radiomyces spectabilis]|uniref:uncharacterized protein n=1 Tax=Radiomyces spectabilis TaxID=64574 RepID=UPI002220F90E|nr:uncharacterized protein BYT42DRAFT_261895 [Radiomyces spectabilis]KAI8384461.1 hypothetical protein BYT42DRAFT_261895 [Radiomyces spectabilis]
MKPGQLVVYDYRDATPASISTTESHPSLKVLQWNVERNYASEDILTIMNQLDPDVAILQEVDIDCKRSGSRNHMEEMCKALKMKGGFVCEFHEIDSPVRELRNEGGGFHGNAILSKYDIDFQVLEHQYQPFDWPKDGLGLGEPREGRRPGGSPKAVIR